MSEATGLTLCFIVAVLCLSFFVIGYREGRRDERILSGKAGTHE